MNQSRGGKACGQPSGPPAATIVVLKDYVEQGDGAWNVHIEFDYFVPSHGSFDLPVAGDAPTPTDTTLLSFTAQWNDNPDLPQVLVNYTGTEPAASLAALDWTEVVTSSANPGLVCATAHDNPGSATLRISDVLTTCPVPSDVQPTYSVEISF